MLKILFVATFIFISCSSVIYGQNVTQTGPKAYKFAQFGPTTVARIVEKMKAFDGELNGLQTAQGYVINYGSPKFIKARTRLLLKGINFRRYDTLRMTFLDVVSNKKKATIMWIVPQGAETPTP